MPEEVKQLSCRWCRRPFREEETIEKIGNMLFHQQGCVEAWKEYCRHEQGGKKPKPDSS